MNARSSKSTLFIALLAGFSAFAAVLANPDASGNDPYDEEALVELLDFLQEELDDSIEEEQGDQDKLPTDSDAPEVLPFDDQPVTSVDSGEEVEAAEPGAGETDSDKNEGIVTPPTTAPVDGAFPVTPVVPTSIGDAPRTTTGPATTEANVPTTQKPVVAPPTTTSSSTSQPTTPTTAAPTATTAPTTQAPTTTVFVPTPGFTAEISPFDYKIKVDFDPAKDLPTAAARQAHADFWTSYNDPDNIWPRNPAILFAAEGANNGLSKGTYDYARKGFFFTASIVELMRTTGDPKALDELVFWSEQLKSNLKDHDGRGYTYFRYNNPPVGTNKKFHYTDTNFLDEQLHAGAIAHTAWALHQNRGVSAAAAREADFWFAYLDENWVPKWHYRSTVGTPDEYVPPTSLGLQNAVDWDSPDQPLHDDRKTSYRGSLDKYSGPGINHTLPVREFGHPYMASMFQYYAMGEYFAQTGKTPKGSPNGAASGYSTEAETRNKWWMQQTTPQADGSREWWLKMTTRNAGLRTGGYSTHVSIYINALHWERFGNFASEANMRSYAKVWANPAAPNDDVYTPGNVKTMTYFADSTGGTDKYRMMFHSVYIPFDDSGILADLLAQTVVDTERHWIQGNTGTTHGSHYTGILNAELVRSLN